MPRAPNVRVYQRGSRWWVAFSFQKEGTCPPQARRVVEGPKARDGTIHRRARKNPSIDHR